MSSDQVLIEARGIRKIYGKGSNASEVLRDISLTIHQGESVAIVGKSGSGKSTLLHLLAQLDRPTHGEVLVEGEVADSMSARELNSLRNKKFGFVFQQFFLNENDTVLNNVVLPLKIAGVNRSERNDRGLKTLQAVELRQKSSAKAGTLSGGQKQRVCIARALVNEPGVIFADEPTGNLDSHTGKTIEDTLFHLNEEKGITLIIVTHDRELATRCGRQIYIKDGHVINRSVV